MMRSHIMFISQMNSLSTPDLYLNLLSLNLMTINNLHYIYINLFLSLYSKKIVPNLYISKEQNKK